MLQKLLLLSAAGACGTLSRFALCELASKAKNCPLPLGTFSVNILGSFLFGLIYVLAGKKLHISGDIRLIVLTGFMGAFTTFSTFAFETAQMLGAAQWAAALGNIFAQITLGIAALAIGVLLGRML